MRDQGRRAVVQAEPAFGQHQHGQGHQQHHDDAVEPEARHLHRVAGVDIVGYAVLSG